MFVLLLLALTPFRADRVEIIEVERERIVCLFGNVVIENDDGVITCNEARINEAQGVIDLAGTVTMKDANGEINAGSATFYYEEDRGRLRDRVQIVTDRERITSDSMYYDGARNWVEMHGNVVIEDDQNSMTATGQTGAYDLALDEGSLSGAPELQIARAGKAPMLVQAVRFALFTRDDRFHGYDGVRAIIDSITVYCDTFSYDLRSETGALVHPVIREKHNELAGAAGSFRLKNREIERFEVVEGRSVYHTKEGSKNTIEGGRISITFSGGQAVRIEVDSLPRGVLHLKRSQEDAGD